MTDLLTLTEMGQLPEEGILYDGTRPVAAELSALGKANAELFEKHLKSEVMFETYLKLLEKLEK